MRGITWLHLAPFFLGMFLMHYLDTSHVLERVFR